MSRLQGLRACCPKKPEWGLRRVLSDDGEAKVIVFFPGSGKQTLDTSTEYKRYLVPSIGASWPDVSRVGGSGPMTM